MCPFALIRKPWVSKEWKATMPIATGVSRVRVSWHLVCGELLMLL